MRDSVVFYRSFYEAMKELPETDQAAIYNALFAYALDGEEPQLSGVQSAVFKLMRPSIDSNNQRYENGCKGGRPKTKTEPNRNQNRTKPKPYEDVYEDESVDEYEDGEDRIARTREDAFLLADGSAFVLPSTRIAEFEKTFPDVNVKAELLRCRLKHNAMRQRRTALTIEQYIVNWLINAQGDAKKARSGTSFNDMQKREEPLNDKFMKELAARPGNLI